MAKSMHVQKESEKIVKDKSTGLLNATPQMPSPALLGEKITAMAVFPCFVSTRYRPYVETAHGLMGRQADPRPT